MRIEDEARDEPVGVLVRTPDRQQTEFDDSAAERRWRSPRGRAERQRGQGAEGPEAISPGAHFNQYLSNLAAAPAGPPSNIPDRV
jgi:hypothetical protein